MYCFLFSLPPLTKSVEVPFAVKINPSKPYSTRESSVSLTVFHVTTTSFKVSATNKKDA
jgi:hypothetical protein